MALYTISELAGEKWEVRKFASGDLTKKPDTVYVVETGLQGGWFCNCPWGRNRPGDPRQCKHMVWAQNYNSFRELPGGGRMVVE